MNICLVNFVPRVLSYPFYGERKRERPKEITKDDIERGAIKSEVRRYLAYPDTKTTCLKKHLWFVSQ